MERLRELQRLLDDHFWAWEGLSEKADQREDIAGLLRITQSDTMREVLLQQEAGARAKTPEEYERSSKELVQRLFDETDFHLSPSAYELLEQAAKRANAAARLAGAVAPVDDLPADLELPFATCRLGVLTVGQFLEAYTQRPVETRPNLEDPEAMAGVLRDIWARELLVAEAQRRGLNESDLVRRRVHADRSSLARQWALEQMTKKAVEAMKEPGIESDYSNDLQERLRAQEMQRLRRGRSVWVDEGLLDRLPVRWPAAPVPPALKASDAAWDGDTRDHVAKRGETHTRLVFTLTNVSSTDLVIHAVQSPVQYVTLRVPPLPWRLGPGERGRIRADVDLRNKTGVGQATIEVESSKGAKTLTLNLTYPRDRATR